MKKFYLDDFRHAILKTYTLILRHLQKLTKHVKIPFLKISSIIKSLYFKYLKIFFPCTLLFCSFSYIFHLETNMKEKNANGGKGGLRDLDLLSVNLTDKYLTYEYPSYHNTLLLAYKDVPTFYGREYVKHLLIDYILAYRSEDKRGQSKVANYIIAEETIDGAKYVYCLVELKNRIGSMNIKTLDLNGYKGAYRVVSSRDELYKQLKEKSHLEDWNGQVSKGEESKAIVIELKDVEIEKEVEIKEVEENNKDMKGDSFFAKCFDFVVELVLLPIKIVKYVSQNILEALKFVLKEIMGEIIKIAIKVIAYIICLYMLISLIEMHFGTSIKSFIYELFYHLLS